MGTYINAIGTANPPLKIPQKKVASFMASALQMNERQKHVLDKLYEATGIDHRYSVLEDFDKKNGDFTFFPNTPDLEPFPTVSKRMQLYREKALQIAVNAIEDACHNYGGINFSEINHLITISCTGMYAPGLDIEIVEHLGLPKNIERTSINYMGCYAAFNGLKLADKICKAEPGAKVLIVAVELCSIHFQKSREKDHLLANALFSDGAAAVIAECKPAGKHSLEIEAAYCDIFSNGKYDMAWHISDFGFEMTLSSYVPSLIKKGIKDLTDKLLGRLHLSLHEIDYFAIHPGGRRILEVCEEELQLERDDNRFAYHVLKNYGNMSSATVLFVLKDIMSQLNGTDDGKHLLSFAFGPGLTLESMVLKIHDVQQQSKGS